MNKIKGFTVCTEVVNGSGNCSSGCSCVKGCNPDNVNLCKGGTVVFHRNHVAVRHYKGSKHS